MNAKRFLAIIEKEIIQIKRDTRSIAIVIAMPLVMMLAFGYGVNFDVKHIPTYIYDMERSQESQDFLERFQASLYFRVVKEVGGYEEIVQAIDSGKCQVAIVVPADFSRKLHSGEMVSVQALVDGTDGNSANLAIGYTQALVRSYAQQIQMQWLQRQGYAKSESIIRVEARTWFNESLESMANIVPGVVVLVMAVIGTFLTSLTIAREWERGTMEQLISTPVTPMEIMLGKLTPYLFIGLLDTCLCAAMGVWWFGVPFRGQLWLFFLSSSMFLTVVLSLGYLFSVLAKNQLAASQFSLVSTFLPSFLLSGFMFPIEQMPSLIQFITHIVPARYYMNILRNVFLKGIPITMMWLDFLGLAIFALFLGFIATRVFKKRLD